MFIDTYIALPLWIFAIFGFIYFLANVFDSLEALHKKQQGGFTLIISTRNQEDSIEGIVEDLLQKADSLNSKGRLLGIALVDWNSSDKTPEVMRHLCEKYPIVKLVKPGDLISYIKYEVFRETQH